MATATAPDHYKILGVAPDADASAIKTAYRKLVLKCHPDKVSDPALKEQKQDEFQKVQESYETLSDPEKRERYDLEQRARELRERERTRSTRTTPAAAPRAANVRVSTNPDFRSSPQASPPKMSSYKSYSGVPEYKTRESSFASYGRSSKHSYEPEIRSRRSASDEKLRREEYRESRRKEEEREEYRRAKDRKEREEYERRKLEKLQREARERDREEREYREAQMKAAAKAEKKARERMEREREKEKSSRSSKPRSPYMEPYYAEEEDRKSRKTKSPKKESSSRDKSSSKMRDRSSAREEVPLPSPPPEMPVPGDMMKSKLDFAANYIKGKTAPLPKHTTPEFSDSYPDPNRWAPPTARRTTSGEARYAPPAAEPVEILEGGSPSRPDFDTASAQATTPPRLRKADTAPVGQMPYATTEMPSHVPKRATLSRAQTMGPEYLARHHESSSRYKPSRGSDGRSSMEDSRDDYFLDAAYAHTHTHAPKVYTIRRGEKNVPRVSESYYSTEPTPSPGGGPFGKVKTAAYIRPEHAERTRSYGLKDAATMDYQPMFSHNPNPVGTQA